MIHNKRRKTSRSGSYHPEEKNKNRNKGGDTRSCGSDSGRTDRDRGEETLSKTILSDGAETQTLNNTDFCIGVASNVILERAKKGINFAISPLCLHLGLSIVAKGSSGDTLNQLLSLLGVKSAEDLDSQTCHMLAHLSNQKGGRGRGPLLSFVNGAWIRKGLTFRPCFKATLNGVYKAQTQEVDVKTKADEIIKEINSWADNATKGLIKHLLPSGSIDSRTHLVLANALYFKGRWQQIFRKSQTITKRFHLLNRRVVRVPFMTCSGKYLYGSFDGYEVVSCSYQSSGNGKWFSMRFLLPDTVDGLPNLVQKVISNPTLLNQQLKFVDVDLWIPRFKFSSEFEASQNLKQLGLVLPFQSGGLTEMVDSPCIRLSNIFHKSCIQVNEQGTKAAAANSLRFATGSRKRPLIFVANRPFMFMIREDTSGIVFFTGAVLNPLKH